MNDFEDKLETILNNPHAMEQIMSLAKSLGGSASTPTNEDEPERQSPGSPFDFPDIGSIDPKLLSAVASLLTKSQQGDDQRVALLQSLKPFVKEQRYAKLDKAIQIARLSRLIRMAFELFHAKEDSHV